MLLFESTTLRLVMRYGRSRALRLARQLRRTRDEARGTLVRADVPELPHPVYLRAQSTDRDVLKQVFVKRHLDFPVTHEPRFIVDAGANIGLASVLLARRFPDARIIALEIEAGNYALLRRNVAPYPNITPRLCGLWSHQTRLAIANPDAQDWGFRAEESRDTAPALRSAAADDAVAVMVSGATDTVPSVSVTDLLAEAPFGQIDLLKIDIEGAERDVFGHGADAWLDKVRTLAVELHEWFAPGSNAAVEGAVAGHGFRRDEWGEYTVFTRAEGVSR